MKRTFAIGTVVLVVLVLVVSFLVYPAVAAPQARDEVQSGLDAVAKSSGVKFEGVTITVDGGNAVSRVVSGQQVGDIAVKIDRIVIPDFAGAQPSATADPASADESVDELLDSIENVGSISLSIGEIVSGSEKLKLRYSSFTLSDEEYRLNLRIAEQDIDELGRGFGLALDANATGQRVNGTLDVEGMPGPPQKFDLKFAPTADGRAISYELNGKKGESDEIEAKDTTITELSLTSGGGVYSFTIAGTYDFDAVRRDIEKSAREVAAETPTGVTGGVTPPTGF